ncbi:MAG: RNA methyltransferase [Defluviitaleaceae bacterium]|nr:RNA methyltransferase [Defluviitaleaceae bacterium]
MSKFREIKLLKTKKGRSTTGLFMVEGETFVREIPGEWDVQKYVLAQRFAHGRDLTVYTNRAPVEVVKDSIFDGLADTITPQGIIAVVKQKCFQVEDILQPGGFILAGEQLNDPGNIGTLIRTAAAAGASGLVLTEGSGDIYNPKVLRSAAGAVLRLPIVVGAVLSEVISQLKENNYAVYAAHLGGDVLPYDLDLQGAFCWLVGNETHGLTVGASFLADILVRLPMARDVESLNASVAGGVLLYEAVRQRLG